MPKCVTLGGTHIVQQRQDAAMFLTFSCTNSGDRARFLVFVTEVDEPVGVISTMDILGALSGARNKVNA